MLFVLYNMCTISWSILGLKQYQRSSFLIKFRHAESYSLLKFWAEAEKKNSANESH